MDKNTIVKQPVISEKSIIQAENGVYTFKVATSTNKIEVKDAIEKLFKVKVTDVNMIVVKGKTRRFGRKGKMGKMADWKKAIVTLKEGDKIEIMKG
ncbi:TPA: 50S ribosomal protein L23 [candidate division CPR2 bacterium]|uniref:Large ribosomal subunit protein uL23 n=1 Tax=candidate division CPR2 bacterium GW2011_GWC1_41_48 TaxID=1618344 RepID=A0A0G0W781_UNCC2|nr:MAG: 50S ribosomal protein L23 [candidate division CPR2 bacterium GW2011_GWC2_39_35]KKR27153.1 MAG: 50S ribosomal protein L23 [candidate division CPR2 bacterium GW2011_GWD2_39_7]KKR27708.1 MAG: 50S ribosomal protein L23 [candidate division CPR2 bacterium GW2011_GWD1_39_7]KKS08839.1 MAG: 50S ribosomal protein L23 [candidate division CPR2 bacterium GW2011_GWC1_41_48]OGB59767.1 MAG: 50S ribosomal protein L23 [candidate division CPR2 bacterium GWD1_39_7]OGB70302.1 MAG: 50S ribosomal protein L23